MGKPEQMRVQAVLVEPEPNRRAARYTAGNGGARWNRRYAKNRQAYAQNWCQAVMNRKPRRGKVR